MSKVESLVSSVGESIYFATKDRLSAVIDKVNYIKSNFHRLLIHAYKNLLHTLCDNKCKVEISPNFRALK